MFIVVYGFIPNENDILGNGGRSVNVRYIPISNYEKAKENPYHRVYDDDDKFRNCKLTENIMREKRQQYWANKILSGSETRR